MEEQHEFGIEELNYLEDMGVKAEGLLDKHFLHKDYSITKEEPFPLELIEVGARILIDVAVVNTPLRSFHVVHLIEGHIFLLNVQDKNKNTVADVIFLCGVEADVITIEEISVSYKAGAILYRYEEMAMDADEEAVAEVAQPIEA